VRLVASTPTTMAQAILKLANDATSRHEMGRAAQRHIRSLADPVKSLSRLELALQWVKQRCDNPFAAEDLKNAKATAAYLDAQQFGHTLGEQLALRPFYWRVRFHQLRSALRSRFLFPRAELSSTMNIRASYRL